MTDQTDPSRLGIEKTYKLFIGGKFPRSESGRVEPVGGVFVSNASRKDLRDAVEAASKGLTAWSGSTPYLRGQIMYRLAEMMEGRSSELASAGGVPESHVIRAIDRVVHFAGWCDKHAQVLGGANPVSGPYHNFSVPEPVGVIAVVAPASIGLLGMVSLLSPALAAGNACVVITGMGQSAVAASVFAEALATSDLPAGAVNMLPGDPAELAEHIASHGDIAGIHAAADDDLASTLRGGAATNLKRVVAHSPGLDWEDDEACEGPGWLEPLIEIKTIWHPSSV